ncbi:hypothetical protein LMH87_001893 [Akanthomyces muscarius]|uniref:Uncharacterized protein n=1 Tax=Akanthomyces muscarius TaxID=2231603 RepID=A0A9W8UIW0_AKAMU|nr:hypothetical protein LMH87_001893 [Akanthomyces muscarius]KAJ4147369.1 hypothetical protein LMH87_001893 [Akanthomyces muscarius]
MATPSHALLKLFTSDAESSHMSFDPSLPSPPESNTSYSSSAMLSRVDSGSSGMAYRSNLNPESAVWTPAGWGDFSSATSKSANTTTSSTDDFAQELLSQAIAQGSASSAGTP